MTHRAAHRLTRQQRAALPLGPIRNADDERRYFHDVGMASRIRIHRELAADHATCPYCDEELR